MALRGGRWVTALAVPPAGTAAHGLGRVPSGWQREGNGTARGHGGKGAKGGPVRRPSGAVKYNGEREKARRYLAVYFQPARREERGRQR